MCARSMLIRRLRPPETEAGCRRGDGRDVSGVTCACFIDDRNDYPADCARRVTIAASALTTTCDCLSPQHRARNVQMITANHQVHLANLLPLYSTRVCDHPSHPVIVFSALFAIRQPIVDSTIPAFPVGWADEDLGRCCSSRRRQTVRSYTVCRSCRAARPARSACRTMSWWRSSAASLPTAGAVEQVLRHVRALLCESRDLGLAVRGIR